MKIPKFGRKYYLSVIGGVFIVIVLSILVGALDGVFLAILGGVSLFLFGYLSATAQSRRQNPSGWRYVFSFFELVVTLPVFVGLAGVFFLGVTQDMESFWYLIYIMPALPIVLLMAFISVIWDKVSEPAQINQTDTAPSLVPLPANPYRTQSLILFAASFLILILWTFRVFFFYLIQNIFNGSFEYIPLFFDGVDYIIYSPGILVFFGVCIVFLLWEHKVTYSKTVRDLFILLLIASLAYVGWSFYQGQKRINEIMQRQLDYQEAKQKADANLQKVTVYIGGNVAEVEYELNNGSKKHFRIDSASDKSLAETRVMNKLQADELVSQERVKEVLEVRPIEEYVQRQEALALDAAKNVTFKLPSDWIEESPTATQYRILGSLRKYVSPDFAFQATKYPENCSEVCSTQVTILDGIIFSQQKPGFIWNSLPEKKSQCVSEKNCEQVFMDGYQISKLSRTLNDEVTVTLSIVKDEFVHAYEFRYPEKEAVIAEGIIDEFVRSFSF